MLRALVLMDYVWHVKQYLHLVDATYWGKCFGSPADVGGTGKKKGILKGLSLEASLRSR